MPLRDLIVSSVQITEEQIEEIISPYIRYDPTKRNIVFLSSSINMTSKQKVLVYLVALKGWAFVWPEEPPADNITPAELEKYLGIPGGTLRPILKELRESHLIDSDAESRYMIVTAALPHIKQEISLAKNELPPDTIRARRRPPVTRRQTPKKETLSDQGVNDEENKTAISLDKKRTKRSATIAGLGPIDRVRGLITEGWFNSPRNVQDLLEELACRGAHYRRTDLTRQMQTLVRRQELRRNKMRKGESGLEVWHYSKW